MKTFVVACTKQHQAVVHGVVGGGIRWTAPAFDCPCRFLAQYATATPTMRRNIARSPRGTLHSSLAVTTGATPRRFNDGVSIETKDMVEVDAVLPASRMHGEWNQNPE